MENRSVFKLILLEELYKTLTKQKHKKPNQELQMDRKKNQKNPQKIRWKVFNNFKKYSKSHISKGCSPSLFSLLGGHPEVELEAGGTGQHLGYSHRLALWHPQNLDM